LARIADTKEKPFRGGIPAAARARAGRHVFRLAYQQGGCPMAAPRLRVFPRSPEPAYQDCRNPSVRVSLRDLLPLIALAQRQKYLWLDDFLDDEVRITSDLYDVIRSFNHCRPSA
jgi:hypothetical protein